MTETVSEAVATETSANDQVSMGPTPGEMLKEAREELGMSAGDIAAKLHIGKQLLLELEADDYHNMQAPIYVKGYLKHYAQIVEVNPQKVLSAFAKLNWQPPVREIKPQSVKLPKYLNQRAGQRKRSAKTMKLMGLLVLLIVGIFVYFGMVRKSGGDLLAQNGQQQVTTGQGVALNIKTAQPDAS